MGLIRDPKTPDISGINFLAVTMTNRWVQKNEHFPLHERTSIIILIMEHFYKQLLDILSRIGECLVEETQRLTYRVVEAVKP